MKSIKSLLFWICVSIGSYDGRDILEKKQFPLYNKAVAGVRI